MEKLRVYTKTSNDNLSVEVFQATKLSFDTEFGVLTIIERPTGTIKAAFAPGYWAKVERA